MKTNEKEIELMDKPANFRDANGIPFVVRCPRCDRENYAPAVSSGRCARCGWRVPEKEVE